MANNNLLEIFRGDIEAYRRLETWGSSLFLGAIALIGKQLLEWDASPTGPALQRAFLLPSLVGFVAFFFLRVVNYRAYNTRHMFAASGTAKLSGKIGTLGWLIALMPLVFGYFISRHLANCDSERETVLVWILGLDIVTFIIAVVVHAWRRCEKRSNRKS